MRVVTILEKCPTGYFPLARGRVNYCVKGMFPCGRRSLPYSEVLAFRQGEISPIGKGKSFPYEREKCFPFEKRYLPIRKGRNWRDKNFIGRMKPFLLGRGTFPPEKGKRYPWQGKHFPIGKWKYFALGRGKCPQLERGNVSHMTVR